MEKSVERSPSVVSKLNLVNIFFISLLPPGFKILIWEDIVILPWLKDDLNPKEILFVLWSPISSHYTILEGFNPPTVNNSQQSNFIPL